MAPHRTSILDESPLIEGSIIDVMIDRTTGRYHVIRKMQSGAHWPQDFIFTIINIRNTKFMLNNIIGHYLT